jgi:hypothetical protein
MFCSEGCNNWAQWRVVVPEKDDNGKVLRLKTVAILCGTHKQAMEAAVKHDPGIEIRFNFVGAVPDGAYHPQS